MRLKTLLLALALLIPVAQVVSTPEKIVSAGTFGRTLLIEPGDCGPGYANDFDPNRPNPYWETKLAAGSDGRLFLTSSPIGGICVFESPNNVSLYAGTLDLNNTPPTDVADGEPALGALMYPAGLDVDSSANVYLSDMSSLRIRKIGSDGLITTVAGNREFGNEGIGGPAILAPLGTSLRGVDVTTSGEVLFVEAEGPRILKIDQDGLLRHVAGKWACLGLGGDGGPAIDAELAWPNDVAVSSTGIVYISDGANGRIRKVDTSGVITTLYGDGNLGPEGCGGFERPGGGQEPLWPEGIAIDSQDNLVIADGQGRLVVISPANDRCYIDVPTPTDVAVDSNDRIVFATRNGQVWRIDDYQSECEPDSPVITTWGETKSPTSYRMAAFTLNFTTNVTGLTADDFTIAGNAPGCSINLDNTPEEYFRQRTVLATCQGTGSVQLTLKPGAVATPDRGSGPPASLEGPEVELVNGAVLRVSKAVYLLGEQGTVTSNVGGVNCGETCAVSVNPGTKITLTATPGPRNVFLGWSGACSGTGTCTVTVTGDIDVQARFFPGKLLVVTKAGTGGGTVSASSGGLSCGSRCSTYVYVENPITLTARAATGSVFSGWFGAGCSGTGSCTVRGGGSVFAVFNRR